MSAGATSGAIATTADTMPRAAQAAAPSVATSCAMTTGVDGRAAMIGASAGAESIAVAAVSDGAHDSHPRCARYVANRSQIHASVQRPCSNSSG